MKNVTWRQHIPNEVLYAGLPRISTTIRERRLRFNGHCWRSKNEVVSDLVLWEPKHGKRNVGRQARTLVDMLEAKNGVPRDCLPAAMDDRVGWNKESHGGSTEVNLVVVAAAAAAAVVVVVAAAAAAAAVVVVVVTVVVVVFDAVSSGQH